MQKNYKTEHCNKTGNLYKMYRFSVVFSIGDRWQYNINRHFSTNFDIIMHKATFFVSL